MQSGRRYARCFNSESALHAARHHWCCSAVSLNVKARVLSGPAADENGPSPDQASAQAQDAQHAHQLLTSLFGQLCSAEGVARMASSHPLLACGACNLLDSYAAWFSKAPEAPLQEAVQLVLACLGRAEVRPAWQYIACIRRAREGVAGSQGDSGPPVCL